MIGNKFQAANRYLVVGPIDRMVRGGLGLIIFLFAYNLPLHILQFTGLLVLVCFIWLTALTGWDPIYYIVKSTWNAYQEKSAINGRFK